MSSLPINHPLLTAGRRLAQFVLSPLGAVTMVAACLAVAATSYTSIRPSRW
ncbi:MAG: hypothetical protein ACOYK7_11735 [Pirellulales bacterium]